jgi:hypothetical protein
MKTGHVRDDSQLADIEDLVARLKVVTKQLAFPARAEQEPDSSPSPCREADEPRPRD